MSVGPENAPLTNIEPMQLARALLYSHFSPSSRQGLFEWRGRFWQWGGERWVSKDEDAVVKEIWLALENAHFVERMRDEEPVVKRLGPTPQMVSGAFQALRALIELPIHRVPFWLEKPKANPNYLLTFQDVIVDVRASAKAGSVVTYPVDETWFDPQTLPFPLQLDARCPVWEESCRQWGGGDPEWTELLERVMAYALLPHRLHAKWILQHGRVRGGKGTATRVLKALQGVPNYSGKGLEDLTGGFGLDGLQYARTLVIGEVAELEGVKAHKAAAILKMMLGEDTVSVNVKYQRPKEVTLHVLPILQANEVPNLPNRGGGLSSKVVVVPYLHSFLGKENRQLDEQLLAELPGIATRLVHAALRLESSSDPFPVLEAAESALRSYRRLAHPMDAFLEARFRKAPGSFVPRQILRSQWEQWKRATGSPLQVHDNHLCTKLERDSSWGLIPTRKRFPDGSRMWGMMGLAIRHDPDDEQDVIIVHEPEDEGYDDEGP